MTPPSDTVDRACLSALVNKIALELVLAEVGKDNGLLPVNSLLGEAEELVPKLGLPDPLPGVLKIGRETLEASFFTGVFDAVSLERLRAWAQWIQYAVQAWEQGEALPPWTQAEVAPPASATAAPSTAGAATAAPASATPGTPEEVPVILNLASDIELLREFVSESHEHLQNIELGVLTLEENPTDEATLNAIFRAFHTFKGGSGFLNLRPINRLAHDLESLLDLARQHRLLITSPIINLILAGGDTLKQFVIEIQSQVNGQSSPGPILIPTQGLLQRVREITQGGSGSGLGQSASTANAALPTAGPSPTGSAAAGAAGDARSGDAGAAAACTAAGPGLRPNVAGAAVKVDTFKLDSLVDLVGEMVIAQSMVTQDTDLLGLQSQQLTRNLAQLSRITKELQRVAMSLRMVPIRATFQKMTRLVRDLSVKAGKVVELELSGEETEVDRTIVEEISDPLVHMIRNAVDHGIEPAAKREAAGKPAQGRVQLRAFHQGGNIVIEIEDDGAGLNRERIRQKAIEKGLVRPNDELSESEIFGLIFAPGFSTAEKVTDISGRGVGMDVVRRNIEKLRGKVEIQSTLGAGSKFTIFLPLTLAIIDGMIVGVGGDRYILPTLAVRESFRPTADMISSVHGRAEVINVRGRLLPLLHLHQLFGIQARATQPTEGIVIVVEWDHQSRCLLVDDLVGKQEVVIKSLGETFANNKTLAGAAILGDGRVGLILDVNALVSLDASTVSLAA